MDTAQTGTTNTGISQGCPRSPYQLGIAMTEMFEDVHARDNNKRERHRPP